MPDEDVEATRDYKAVHAVISGYQPALADEMTEKVLAALSDASER